ncbi:family 16 glycosylhydrolase [Paenibacillus elgii]|uniref:family 16 glycosylhydrolase n=1 Tax=Paenibacillus elgii TaxID=189691 RepID=UPI0007C86441|nr:family 16 glycosylhydrolase [Paenibacillus elgii]
MEKGIQIKRKPIKRLLAISMLGAALVLPNSVFAYGDGGFFEPLKKRNDNLFTVSDNRANGDDFGVGWKASNIEFKNENGFFALRLDDEGCPGGCSNKNYASGEYATKAQYGYGRVEARIKVAKGDGLVTSLFTYYAKDGDTSKNDEIDIEILGKDTTIMETNYFTDGEGEHSERIQLGFDASLDYHNYAFEWSPAYIKWFVDGKLVHTETGSKGKLPTNPGQIMINLWSGAGSAVPWTGKFIYPGTPVRAYYNWIKYIPDSDLQYGNEKGLTSHHESYLN